VSRRAAFGISWRAAATILAFAAIQAALPSLTVVSAASAKLS